MSKEPDWYRRLMGECPPFLHSKPRWEWPSRLERFERLTNMLVLPKRLDGEVGLMDHQRLALRLYSEHDPETDLPRFKELDMVTPRQVGKTTIHMVVSTECLILRDHPGRVAYAAQTFTQGAAKLKDDWWPMLEGTKLVRLAGLNRFGGSQHSGIASRNGGWIRVVSSLEHSVRGIARLDLALLDEVLADRNDAKERVLLPAMLTVPDSQVFLTSTPGTPDSLYLWTKLLRARSLVDDENTRIGLLEYAAPEDSDHLDPATWRAANPALEKSIPLDSYASLAESMSELRFRQELLGQWVDSHEEGGIPWEDWTRMTEAFASGYQIGGPIVLGVDSTPDQARVTVCASDGKAVWLVGVIAPAVDVVPQLEVMVERTGARGIVHQKDWALLHQTEAVDERFRAERMDRPMWYEACGRTLSGVLEGDMLVSDSEILRTSNGHSYRRAVGSRWVWDRREDYGDISPMVALTLAYGGHAMFDWESQVSMTLM